MTRRRPALPVVPVDTVIHLLDPFENHGIFDFDANKSAARLRRHVITGQVSR